MRDFRSRKIVDMPFGGSVTACSMLPILIIAYRYGTKWGLFTAFAAVMLHLQILQEERYLTGTFGAAYQEYMTQVYRYLGRKPRR